MGGRGGVSNSYAASSAAAQGSTATIEAFRNVATDEEMARIEGAYATYRELAETEGENSDAAKDAEAAYYDVAAELGAKYESGPSQITVGGKVYDAGSSTPNPNYSRLTSSTIKEMGLPQAPSGYEWYAEPKTRNSWSLPVLVAK